MSKFFINECMKELATYRIITIYIMCNYWMRSHCKKVHKQEEETKLMVKPSLSLHSEMDLDEG